MNCTIDTLQRSNENNKLTIFVGSGVSKSSKLPSWEDLVNIIKSDLQLSDKETDYLKIAQLFYLSCGEVVYYQKIKKFFPDNVEPTIIQKLIFDLKPANIITTNWDTLLEKTARDNGYIYDVISKDEHLVQSELENHIVKMHGDFKDNNIVFKEDDYINYKNNFPLIENYIKSILSTNTILFLGYSYSDINLKQIVKWIQNSSSVMPPMFLTVFKEDKNQSAYLENFGVRTIVLDQEDKSFQLDSYSSKLARFLSILNLDDRYKNNTQDISDFEVIAFVYNRLKPLDELDAILLKQIQSALSNVGFVYEETKDENLILLEFYDGLLTYDIDKEIRNIYRRFRQILTNDDAWISNQDSILKIFSILKKANIDGIIVDVDTAKNKKYHNFSKQIAKNVNHTQKSICNFDFNNFEANENDIKEMMRKAFLYYQQYDFLKAYKTNEKTIKLCLKLQNYTQLFLAMFNQNILIMGLKQSLHNIGSDKKYKTASEAWQYKIKPYNLDEKFYELPKTIQKVLYEIKPFVNKDYLYRFASEIEDELYKKLKQKKAIETNGGMTWDTNVTRNYSKQKNLIYFVLNNFIMMERKPEFITINKKIIQISLIRQMQKDYFTLDKLELFVILKYIAHKDLVELVGEFKDFKLKIDIKTINWLTIKVFPNVCKLYSKNKTIYFDFSDELRNILYISSFDILTKKQLEVMLGQIKFLIGSRRVNLDIYELINRFIGSQENTSEKDLVDILEMMIDKIVCNKGNIWDYKVIEDNHLWSPFKHLNNQKIVYSNLEIIKKLIQEVESFSVKQKIHLATGFLINIYHIGNEEIKDLVKKFILEINLDDLSISNLSNIDIHNTQNFDFDGLGNYGLKISFKLFLAIQKFIDIDDEFIEEIKQYPNKDKENLDLLGQITGQVKYLVEKMKIKDFEELLEVLRNSIKEKNEKYKNINRMII